MNFKLNLKSFKEFFILGIIPIIMMLSYVFAIFYQPSKPVIGFVYKETDKNLPIYKALESYFSLRLIDNENEGKELLKDRKLTSFINIHIFQSSPMLQAPIKLVLEGSRYGQRRSYPLIIGKIVSTVRQKIMLAQIQKGMSIDSKNILMNEQKKWVNVECLYGEPNLTIWDIMARIFVEFFTMMLIIPVAIKFFFQRKKEFYLNSLQPSFFNHICFIFNSLFSFSAILLLLAIMKTIFIFYIAPITTQAHFSHFLIVTFINSFLVILYAFLLANIFSYEMLTQRIMMFIAPQMIFSGTTDITKFYDWVSYIKYLIPLPYNVYNTTNVIMRNFDFVSLFKHYFPWIGIVVVYFFLSTLIMYLKRNQSLIEEINS